MKEQAEPAEGDPATLDPSPLIAALEMLEQRVTALQRDRDYWRRQHDLVMADWKDDLARLEGIRT